MAELDFEAVEMAARRQALCLAARALEQRLNADTSDYVGPELPCGWRIITSPTIPQSSLPCYDSAMRNLRVEESTTGGRCSLAVSAVSSFVPV